MSLEEKRKIEAQSLFERRLQSTGGKKTRRAYFVRCPDYLFRCVPLLFRVTFFPGCFGSIFFRHPFYPEDSGSAGQDASEQGSNKGSPSVLRRAMRAFGSRDSLNSIGSAERKVSATSLGASRLCSLPRLSSASAGTHPLTILFRI